MYKIRELCCSGKNAKSKVKMWLWMWHLEKCDKVKHEEDKVGKSDSHSFYIQYYKRYFRLTKWDDGKTKKVRWAKLVPVCWLIQGLLSATLGKYNITEIRFFGQYRKLYKVKDMYQLRKVQPPPCFFGMLKVWKNRMFLTSTSTWMLDFWPLLKLIIELDLAQLLWHKRLNLSPILSRRRCSPSWKMKPRRLTIAWVSILAAHLNFTIHPSAKRAHLWKDLKMFSTEFTFNYHHHHRHHTADGCAINKC